MDRFHSQFHLLCMKTELTVASITVTHKTSLRVSQGILVQFFSALSVCSVQNLRTDWFLIRHETSLRARNPHENVLAFSLTHVWVHRIHANQHLKRIVRKSPKMSQCRKECHKLQSKTCFMRKTESKKSFVISRLDLSEVTMKVRFWIECWRNFKFISSKLDRVVLSRFDKWTLQKETFRV